MEILTDKRKQNNKLTFIAVALFLFVRAMIVFENTKTGLNLKGGLFQNPFRNICFDVLTLIFSVLLAYVLYRVYLTTDANMLVLILLVAADPKISVLQSNVLELVISILSLGAVVLMNRKNTTVGNTALWICSAVAALVLPLSLFGVMPILLVVSFFSKPRKERTVVPPVVAVVIFALVSFLRVYIYNRNSSKISIFMSEYADSFELFTKVGKTFYVHDIIVYGVTAFSVILCVLFFKKLYDRSGSLGKKEKAEFQNSFVTSAVVMGFSMLLTVVGEMFYCKSSTTFTILIVVFILLVRNNEKFAVEILDKINDFADKHFIVFVFILLLLSVIFMQDKAYSVMYRIIGFDFVS